MNNLIQWPTAKYWTAQWNAVIGCKPISPACKNCYAAAWAKRFGQSVAAEGISTTGRPYRMLEWGTPRAAFECWLNTGMTMKSADRADDEPCLFAGTGFSESDGSEEGGVK